MSNFHDNVTEKFIVSEEKVNNNSLPRVTFTFVPITLFMVLIFSAMYCSRYSWFASYVIAAMLDDFNQGFSLFTMQISSKMACNLLFSYSQGDGCNPPIISAIIFPIVTSKLSYFSKSSELSPISP